LRTAIAQVAVDLEEAAAVSGARFVRFFYNVTLPLIKPMVVSVFLLVFAATVRDISTVLLLATPGTQTLSLLMFNFAVASKYESAAVLGVMIAAFSLVMTWIVMRLSGGDQLER